MRLAPALAAFAVLALCLPFAWHVRLGGGGTAERLYVADLRSSDVRVIDPGSGRLLRRVAVAQDPHELACADGSVWTSNYRSAQITRISTLNARSAVIAVPGEPHGLATSGDFLAVTQGRDGLLALVSPATGELHELALGGEPYAAVATASRVYVLDPAKAQVNEVDPGGPDVLRRVDVGRLPESLAVSPDGRVLAVASALAHTLSLIDTAAFSETRRILLPGAPVRVVFAPDGSAIAVSLADAGQVALIGADGAIRGVVAVGRLPDGLAFTADGRTLYVALAGDSRVAVLATPALVVRRYLRVGAGPSGILFLPDGRCPAG